MDTYDVDSFGKKVFYIIQALGWRKTRREETLQAMLTEELAMIDDQGPGGERLYWFPCLADFSNSTAMAA